jgi:hypothetical protein
LLFRWFVDWRWEAPIRDVTVLGKSRERLVEGEIASKFVAVLLSQLRIEELISSKHVSGEDMETRHGLAFDAWLTLAVGTAQRERHRPWPKRERATVASPSASTRPTLPPASSQLRDEWR